MSSIVLRCQNDAAEITRHGGQLLRWQVGGVEQLYLSPRASFAPGATIRGGVPIIFPQFNARGPWQRHGFARNQLWQGEADAHGQQLTLRLCDDTTTRALWPFAFRAALTVMLHPGQLTLTLIIENRSDVAFEFTAALHSYFALGNIQTAQIHGLENLAYLDGPSACAPVLAPATPLCPLGPIDRIYPQAPQRLRLSDGQRELLLEHVGFNDCVVWNPGPADAAALKDLGAEQAARFVCIEPAVILNPVRLEPQQQFRASQMVSVICAG